MFGKNIFIKSTLINYYNVISIQRQISRSPEQQV